RTTQENALFTASILQPRQVKQILLVTDSPHMLRSLLTFRRLGFDVIPHISPIPPKLTPTKTAMLVFYEYMGLVSYGLEGRFFPLQNVAENKTPPIAKLRQ
ncbi:YdcF family protein, partial [Aetokthonos hydrillicola]